MINKKILSKAVETSKNAHVTRASILSDDIIQKLRLNPSLRISQEAEEACAMFASTKSSHIKFDVEQCPRLGVIYKILKDSHSLRVIALYSLMIVKKMYDQNFPRVPTPETLGKRDREEEPTRPKRPRQFAEAAAEAVVEAAVEAPVETSILEEALRVDPPPSLEIPPAPPVLTQTASFYDVHESRPSRIQLSQSPLSLVGNHEGDVFDQHVEEADPDEIDHVLETCVDSYRDIKEEIDSTVKRLWLLQAHKYKLSKLIYDLERNITACEESNVETHQTLVSAIVNGTIGSITAGSHVVSLKDHLVSLQAGASQVCMLRAHAVTYIVGINMETLESRVLTRVILHNGVFERRLCSRQDTPTDHMDVQWTHEDFIVDRPPLEHYSVTEMSTGDFAGQMICLVTDSAQDIVPKRAYDDAPDFTQLGQVIARDLVTKTSFVLSNSMDAYAIKVGEQAILSAWKCSKIKMWQSTDGIEAIRFLQ